MASFSAEEKDSYRNVVDAIIRGDPANKASLDETARKLLGSLREVLPEASDGVLAEFSAAICGVSGLILRTEVGRVSEVVATIYQEYAALTAILLGTYDPDDPEVPDTHGPNLRDLLTKVAGPDKAGRGHSDNNQGMYL